MTALLIYLLIGTVFGTWIHIRYPAVPLLMFPISVVFWPIPFVAWWRIEK